MTNDKLIITASGTAREVVDGLKALTAIFGKGATLEEVATATRWAKLSTAEAMQFRIGKGATK